MRVESLLVDEPLVEHEATGIFGVAMQFIDHAPSLGTGRFHHGLQQGKQFFFVPGKSLHVYVQNYVGRVVFHVP